MLRRLEVTQNSDIPENWGDHTLLVWTQDDVNYEGRESLSAAFHRFNPTPRRILKRIDLGDVFVHVYIGGWVKAVTYDGGWIGILVDPAYTGVRA